MIEWMELGYRHVEGDGLIPRHHLELRFRYSGQNYGQSVAFFKRPSDQELMHAVDMLIDSMKRRIKEGEES